MTGAAGHGAARLQSYEEPPVSAVSPTDASTSIRSVHGATSLVGDLTAIGTGRVTAAVLSLCTALITTRMLGPAGYGTLAIVGVASMLIFTVSFAWTGVSVRRYGREDLELRGDMSRLTWNRILIGAPLAVAAVLVLLGLKAVGGLPATLTWTLVGIAIATGVVNIVVDHWCCLLETSGRMKISAAGQVLSQAAYVGVLVALFAVGVRAAPQGVLLLALGSAALLAFGAAPFVWRAGVVPVGNVDRALLRRMLWLSAPTIGLLVSQYIFGSIDIIALRIFRTQREVGLYAVAYQAYTVLSAAAVTTTAVMVPLFVSLRLAGRESLIQRYMDRGVGQGMFVIATFCGLAIAPIPVFVPVVFGHAFRSAAWPMSVLVAGLAFLFIAYLFAPILTLYERTRTTAVINALAALINVIGDLVLLGLLHLGVIAPAIATSCALIFMAIAFYGCSRREFPESETPPLWVLAPLVPGLALTGLLHGVLGMLAAMAGVLAVAAAILIWRPPFVADDAKLVAKLDLPAPLKRAAIRLVELVT